MDFSTMIEEGLQQLNLSLLPSGNADSESDFEIDDDSDGPDIEEEKASTSTQKDKKDHNNVKKKCSSEDGVNLDDLDVYVEYGSSLKEAKKDNLKRKKFSATDKLLMKSVIVPGFEKLHSVPLYDTSDRILRLERKKARELTKGEKWFNMPATELTEEVKNDLEVLQMRSVLDPKHFYKKNDLKVLPKYFQIGRVVDNPADFYSSRIPKKQRKKTIVEELLADADFKRYNKKRYTEIIEERRKTQYKAHRHAKRLKRKGKSKK